MKKIHYFIFLSFLLLVANNTFAQNGRKDKIKALKIAFITEKLALTSKEAQEFWPIYNQFDDENQQLRRQKLQKIKKEIRDFENLSEKRASQLLNELENVNEQQHLARKKLTKDLKKIIAAKKIILLKKAEDDFKKQLLQKFRERRQKHFKGN